MKTRVLFLCSGNSARSIIGAALLKQMAGDEFDVHSAGTHPKGINPYAVRVLRPLGIELVGERSKNVSEYEGQTFDQVITVCDSAAEACPVFIGAPKRTHWSFADPAAVEGSDEEKLAAFERTVSEMRTQLRAFVGLTNSSERA